MPISGFVFAGLLFYFLGFYFLFAFLAWVTCYWIELSLHKFGTEDLMTGVAFDWAVSFYPSYGLQLWHPNWLLVYLWVLLVSGCQHVFCRSGGWCSLWWNMGFLFEVYLGGIMWWGEDRLLTFCWVGSWVVFVIQECEFYLEILVMAWPLIEQEVL